MTLIPYYNEGDITIYHGDCREIIPQLEPVDLVLTDPPYGIDYQSGWRIDWQRKDKIYGDKEFPLWIFDDIHPLIALFVWCRWDILPKLPKPKSFIVWDKMIHSMGDLKHEYGRRWEACAFYPGPKHSFIKRPVDIISCMRISPEKLRHPNEKPVGAITPLIRSHPGNTILDPFMGSGTTLVAAKELGRKAIGIEIEEKYVKIAIDRLRQEVFQWK